MYSGVYVHIPYCRKKCLYCDFFSGGDRNTDWNRLVTALKEEYLFRRKEISVPADTLYIGGGTPSLMPADSWQDLMSFLMNNIVWGEGKREITMEVNPDDVTEELCVIWRESGVSRVSLGVQSFVDDELKIIGRRHDSGKAVWAFNVLNNYFSNISVDLMFGLPGQTKESWRHSVSQALKLSPQHISAYTLMFEEGTAMTLLRDKGKLQFPDEEDNLEMWRILSDSLIKSGFRQYEISNYSLPGYESCHNRKYWDQSPYLGLGPSAHSYDGKRIRRFNPSDLKGYLSRYCDTECVDPFPYYKEEKLNDEELAEEFILTRMRTAEGLSVDEFGRRFGEKAYERLLKNIRAVKDVGLVVESDGNIALSREGIMVADNVIVSLAI